MNDPSAAMQVAIYSRLTSHAAMLAAFGGPVRAYDKTPGPKPEYPYLRIGDDQILPRSNACMDGWDCVVTIHIFSQHAQRPRMQVKEISDAILQAIATAATPPIWLAMACASASSSGRRGPTSKPTGSSRTAF